MTHNIIKTDNYLLIGSDDDIRRGLFYCVRRKNIFLRDNDDDWDGTNQSIDL
jgi:hypothetical protein